ncbi:Cell filamentation protein Fic [Wenzhouxiangella marina]|uniref:Cell filamentation protein Fic n=2 Tax=Wenzhouxiangella marina TaxID=1579979 RepID=A0A0K0XZ79_9GAMM|nr:Cell filamentation protein Fic [Wenzhouxiangella marina]
MAGAHKVRFSDAVTAFQEQRLPEAATPAGYAALIDAYGLAVPLPRKLFATGKRHRILDQDGWRILTPRHAPQVSLEGHLTFALKYEGLDLAVLKRLFLTTGPEPLEAWVRETPTGVYARRIWFLYEWLTGETLDLPDASDGRYVLAVDPDIQFGGEERNESRYRVKNNMPGTPNFCPLVFRTEVLEAFTAQDLAEKARAVMADVPRDILARTAAFLLLKDSRSSYAIEGESAPQDRIQRWGRATGEAGQRPIDIDELQRLQRIVIGDARFVSMGIRGEGGFVGEHDRVTQVPLPEHISARPDDLFGLIRGMSDFDRGPAQQLDPVIAAAALAFGFVYIHPFDDGNGRIHRYLIHHVLAERGFNPPGVVFPVSSAILERIDDYRDVLESYSRRLLPLIEWEPTERNNVEVLNDTGDYYRFFDATLHAEFLYECVQKTIEEDLPQEADFLRRYDAFRSKVEAYIDMPDRTLDLLFRFLQQNDGSFSKRARDKEFSALTEDEVRYIESLYARAFGRGSAG